MSRKYANPPIVEVVCELRASPDSKWDLTIPGLIYEELKDNFPNKEQRVVQEIELQKQEFNNIQQLLRSDERAMFFSPDRKTFVQVGNRLLAINRLKPYILWNELKPKIENAFYAFRKSTEINGLQRIGLRYINRIEITDKQIRLEEYLNFRPFLGGKLPQNLVSFVVGCLIPFSDGRDICKLQISDVIPDKDSNSSFLLDIDYYLNKPLAVPLSEVLEWMELAHQNIEEMFEACITDQLREFFGEVK